MRIKWPYLFLIVLVPISLSCGLRRTKDISSSAYQAPYNLKKPPPLPSKSAPPTTSSKEYLQKGEEYFIAEDYPKALEYFGKAYRLDSTNQDTLAKAGVALTKIGKRDLAKKVFTRVIEINQTTAEADTARRWLNRVNNPLEITILPDVPYNRRARLIPTQRIITKFIGDSKLYHIANYKLLGISEGFSNIAKACSIAKNNGVKIIIITETTFKIEKIAYLKRYYTIYCDVKLHIYRTKTGELVKTLNRHDSWRMKRQKDQAKIIGKRIGLLLFKLVMDVHAILI